MISMAGAIGTGVFVGIAQALRHGGPLGMLLGYTIMGTVVYGVVVSAAEMVSFLPNVGGIIRLADLYVDPALGFAMGWNAWYNWAIILPAEISAAVTLMQYFTDDHRLVYLWVTMMLVVSVGINCFGARLYGESEFWFSFGKIILIITLFIISLWLDLRKGHYDLKQDGYARGDVLSGPGPIGSRFWKNPGPLAQYENIDGATGRFLGFWAVLMQAAFSFFGVEIPGVAAGEVINPSQNIPHAVRRIWVRIFLFYVLSVIGAGLIVPYDHPDLQKSGTISSPFVIALRAAGYKGLAAAVNVGFVTSAWSAASSDIYISSRYLFFLARCNHAPRVCGKLFHRSSESSANHNGDQEGPVSDAPSPSPDAEQTVHEIGIEERNSQTPTQAQVQVRDFADNRDRNGALGAGDQLAAPLFSYPPSTNSTSHSPRPTPSTESTNANPSSLMQGPISDRQAAPGIWPSWISFKNIFREIPMAEKQREKTHSKEKTVPWVGVLVAGLVGLLAYMASLPSSGRPGEVSGPAQAFNYLSSMTAVAALQSWICMMITYLRWYEGVRIAEEMRGTKFRTTASQIKRHRSRFQPWLAIYALVFCVLVLMFNGWALFTQDAWYIAFSNCDQAADIPIGYPELWPIIPKFLPAYLPLAVFLLLFFSYKLIVQTRVVPYADMPFEKGTPLEDTRDGDKEWFSGSIPNHLHGWRLWWYWVGRAGYHFI
ncbi:amino acid permease-domain-containing protein [Cantharellus anzutake]|uniref:amino acid permease-domain-containing protein n=1 Tax=Cantharellus anzutake TaxID=1750568 RepID=UPI001903E355|nr:amino acid permease-domain-containing protein [Cantharellus anzutake]KAF8320590.1 amino acid permease-domain-containing protein [Cantharellus anzutake]